MKPHPHRLPLEMVVVRSMFSYFTVSLAFTGRDVCAHQKQLTLEGRKGRGERGGEEREGRGGREGGKGGREGRGGEGRGGEGGEDKDKEEGGEIGKERAKWS